MRGHQCYHCKQWIEAGEPHDCWTTTEAALTRDLSEDLRDAWERLRETAVEFGEQRIYASHKSIMFARKSCYFFVRPKRSYLEVCVFLPRAIKAPQIRRIEPASKSKLVHFLRIQHRDEVEAPITDWLREAYDLGGMAAVRAAAAPAESERNTPKKTASRQAAARTARTARRTTPLRKRGSAGRRTTVRKKSRR